MKVSKAYIETHSMRMGKQDFILNVKKGEESYKQKRFHQGHERNNKSIDASGAHCIRTVLLRVRRRLFARRLASSNKFTSFQTTKSTLSVKLIEIPILNCKIFQV